MRNKRFGFSFPIGPLRGFMSWSPDNDNDRVRSLKQVRRDDYLLPFALLIGAVCLWFGA